jgi:chlorite dismutase
VSSDAKSSIAKSLQKEAGDFLNDFTPEKGKLETIHYYKETEYTLNGKPVTSKVPTALIRVESVKREKIDAYYKTASTVLKDYFDLEYRVGVTQELKYTDTATLERLKAAAPQRGSGKDQPNAVIFPLSKSPAWWAMPLEKRKQYFDKHPETFGSENQGHNEVGFMYINKIFRKLYHSRYIDSQQDFMTEFEYSDNDVDTFKALLSGLQDIKKNKEWEFVKEFPIFWGKRKASIEEIL